MARADGVSRRLGAWCLSAAVLASVLSACGRDTPLETDAGSVRRPGAPSRLVNPACTGGGTVHAADSITAAVTWLASGSPHLVNGTVALQPGGTLTIEPGAIVTVEVDITNVGPRACAEIAQLYIRDPELTLARPIKELKGFMRLELGPGDTQTAQFKLDMRALAYFDDLRNAWVADAGDFEVQVGSSSADIRARAVLTLIEEWVEAARDSWRSPHI